MAEIVTFYSYKGGTGRSMALANVAWILASNGKRVLAIDWDLEAPGLHRYFMPFLPDPKLLSPSSRGLINYFADFAIQAATPLSEPSTLEPPPTQSPTVGRTDAWYGEWAGNILRYATSLDWKFDRGGLLDLIPAGRQDRHYSSLVNNFNWPNFYERLGGGALLEAIKERLHREYDYVLIDSRTGVSDTSGICTVLLPNSVVLCFTLNNQSITGAVAVAHSIAAQRQPAGAKHPDVRLFPVPMRTDPFEKDRLAERRRFARTQFSKFQKDDSYWDEVEVAYEPYYSYEETLSTFVDEPANLRSMLASFERLTKYLSAGDGIGKLVPPDEKLRQKVLRRFGSRRGSDAVEPPPIERFDQSAWSADSATFEISERVPLAARLRVERSRVRSARYRPLRIYALDPFASDRTEVATVHVPYERLTPGPVGALFDIRADGAPAPLHAQPLDLDDPQIVMSNGLNPTPADGRFHLQMLYAVCSLSYATFSRALGRDIAWAVFPAADDPLRLTVRAFTPGSSAGYSREGGDLAFGYYRAGSNATGLAVADGLITTALSHDLIVHETTHALVDGLRSSFMQPTNIDVVAFQEGFADLVALLLRFTYTEVVERAIHDASGDLTRAGLMLDIARAFGNTREKKGRGVTLALGIDPEGFAPSDSDLVPGEKIVRYDQSLDVHGLGTVLVSAVFEAFVTVVWRKCQRIFALAGLKPRAEQSNNDALGKAVAREIGRVATQFLDVCIRAIDYCPPCDLEFGDYLRAVVTSDADVESLDKWGYRESLTRSFRRRGIIPRNVPYMTEDSARWQPPSTDLEVPELSFKSLRFSGDPGAPPDAAELVRQARVLGRFVTSEEAAAHLPFIPPRSRLPKQVVQVSPPIVQSIRTARRVTPDGRVTFELVGEVTQSCTVVTKERTIYDMTGGCTIILDASGNVRYVISKRLDNEARRDRQLAQMRNQLKSFWIEHNRRWSLRPGLLQAMHAQPGRKARTSSTKGGKRQSART